MFEDYLEIDSRAATELQGALNNRYTSGGQSRRPTLGRLLSVFNVFGHQDQQQPHLDVEQEGHDQQQRSCDTVLATDTATPQGPDSNVEPEALHLLLCVDDKMAKAKLHQETLLNTNDDRDLFTHLRKQHFAKRPWYALRSISGVSLAQASFVEALDANMC